MLNYQEELIRNQIIWCKQELAQLKDSGDPGCCDNYQWGKDKIKGVIRTLEKVITLNKLS